MTAAVGAIALLLLAAGLAGCAPLTPEQTAALEAQQRQYAVESVSSAAASSPRRPTST